MHPRRLRPTTVTAPREMTPVLCLVPILPLHRLRSVMVFHLVSMIQIRIDEVIRKPTMPVQIGSGLRRRMKKASGTARHPALSFRVPLTGDVSI